MSERLRGKSLWYARKLRWYKNLMKWHLGNILSKNEPKIICDALKKIAVETRYGNDLFSWHNFFQYIQAINFAKNTERLNVGLEIGTGYSTLLLPQIKRDNNRIFSMDARPIKDFEIRGYLEAVQDHIEFINEFSVTTTELKSFYNGETHGVFLDTDSIRLRECVPHFIRDYRSDVYWRDLGLNESEKDLTERILEKLFDDDNRLRCFSALFPARFRTDIGFAAPDGRNALDELIKEVGYFDFVFFDSGELPSMIEWMKLKGHIRQGGLAVFHDIYFPKSIKNFLVCASIYCSPEWEIIYQDASTPQGLMVARKIAR